MIDFKRDFVFGDINTNKYYVAKNRNLCDIKPIVFKKRKPKKRGFFSMFKF